MKKKKDKKSIKEKILDTGSFLKTPKTAEEIREEIKDTQGYKIGRDQLKMALLRLLRNHKIKRKKEDKVYKYHL